MLDARSSIFRRDALRRALPMSRPSLTSANVNGRRLELVLGDITRQEVDAIVNAANSRLAGGGGVDGAIHRAGGTIVKEETDRRYPDGCPTGSAVITTAGNLPARFVIHAVGPVWSGGNRNEDALLANAYRASLKLALSNDCRSIAFPALSAGAYRFPVPRASQIAVHTVMDFLQPLPANGPLQLVRYVLFSADIFAEFQSALRAASEASSSS
jgi:O-acetyl-ADP-ribose deacetylase (regulator of RNase III)